MLAFESQPAGFSEQNHRYTRAKSVGNETGKLCVMGQLS